MYCLGLEQSRLAFGMAFAWHGACVVSFSDVKFFDKVTRDCTPQLTNPVKETARSAASSVTAWGTPSPASSDVESSQVRWTPHAHQYYVTPSRHMCPRNVGAHVISWSCARAVVVLTNLQSPAHLGSEAGDAAVGREARVRTRD